MSEVIRRRAAFTLIELLVVIAIIMLLAGLLFPTLRAARNRAKIVRATAEVKQLEMAWKSVLSDYRSWAAAEVDASWSQMDKAAVDYLGGKNPRAIAYMEFDLKSTNSASAMVDPWYDQSKARNRDNIYQLRLTADGTKVALPFPPNTLYRQAALWSKGEDGQQNTRDDVKSWD